MITYNKITTIEEAEKIWNYFSLNEELYDVWEFRHIYWNFTRPKICFLVGYENNKPFCLLPLQWNNEGYWEFFGGIFMSYNKFFINETHKHHIERALQEISEPVYLRWMSEPIKTEKLEEKNPSTYYLPLKELTSIDDYFKIFWEGRSKKRSELKRQLRKIEEKNIELSLNDFSFLPLLAELNLNKFSEKSTFNRPFLLEFFQEVSKRFSCRMLVLKIDNEPVGLAFRIIHKNIIYGINSGVVPGHGSISKYLFIKTIELGIREKLYKYDALGGAFGWKDEFGFKGRSEYFLDLRGKKNAN